jgi:hypothetical protein
LRHQKWHQRHDITGTGQSQRFVRWRCHDHPRYTCDTCRNLLTYLPSRSENDIAAAAVPGGAGYNTALGTTGLDVLMGGGLQFFTPSKNGGKRADGRDLVAEMKAKNYAYASNATEFNAIDGTKQIACSACSLEPYELRPCDPAKEPPGGHDHQ